MTCEIILTIGTTGAQPHPLSEEWWSYTRDCAPIRAEAGIDLGGLDGKQAQECVLLIVEAIKVLKVSPSRFTDLTKHGLLGYVGLVRRLEVLLEWLARHPRATVRVHYPHRKARPKRTRSSTASKRRSPG